METRTDLLKQCKYMTKNLKYTTSPEIARYFSAYLGKDFADQCLTDDELHHLLSNMPIHLDTGKPFNPFVDVTWALYKHGDVEKVILSSSCEMYIKDGMFYVCSQYYGETNLLFSTKQAARARISKLNINPDKFQRNLDITSEIVKRWPKWKRNCLSTIKRTE